MSAENEREDAADANIFKLITGKSKKTETIDSSITKIDKDADIYNMNHYKRGYAVIFNHYQFDNLLLENREGTEKDVAALEETLKQLQFDVIVCTDYTYSQIYDKLNEVAELNHADSDCLLMVALTHGEKGKIYAKDLGYPPDSLWIPFTGEKCSTLAGKPKMFFIQASRAAKINSGARSMFTSKDASSTTYSIPSMADILVMYSCCDGYYSKENAHNGTWFIQCLCEEMKSAAREKDLLDILHRVNQKMALQLRTLLPATDSANQIGSIVSTFTRLLFFYPL